MNFAGKLFRFFIYSNLFIACCAVLMVYQSSQLLLHTEADIYFILFVFFATICSYSFHWYMTPDDHEILTPRMQWLSRHKNIHIVLFIIGFAGTAVAGWFLLAWWQWLLLAAILTFLYSAPKIPHPYFRLLRKVAYGKTIFLAFTWMYVTTILPLLISNQSWKPAFSIFAAHRFFLVYLICILFDYRDREYDKIVGIRSLITWLSEKGITRVFVFSLSAFTIFTLWMSRLELPYYIIIFLLIPGFITAALYRYAQKNFSDSLYYFVLDGLMAFSAILTLPFGY